MNTVSVLETIDWQTFEDVVLKLTIDSVLEYSEMKSSQPLEKIYQISIQTNPQIRVSSVGFETVDHAKRDFLQSAGISDEEELQGAINAWEPFDYQSAASEFKYYEFRTAANPELDLLRTIAYIDNIEIIEARVESSLLRVVERVKPVLLGETVYCEDSVWIGVSSPRDWYDDRTQLRVR